MTDYFKRLWHGELPFWHVFWVWVILGNGIWVTPYAALLFLPYDFIGAKLAIHEVLRSITNKIMLIPLVCLMFFTPATLLFSYRSSKEDSTHKTITTLAAVCYVAIFVFWLFAMVIAFVAGMSRRFG